MLLLCSYDDPVATIVLVWLLVFVYNNGVSSKRYMTVNLSI
jgi:hypothetical protein